MIVTIEGEQFEIPDGDIRKYIDEQDGVEPEEESNKFIFGIHVNHTRELAEMGNDIASFMKTVGEGVVEVQVSVNAKLAEHKDMVVGFDLSHLEPAIGHAEMTEYDYDDDDEYYPEEDKLSEKTSARKKVAPRRGSAQVRKVR